MSVQAKPATLSSSLVAVKGQAVAAAPLEKSREQVVPLTPVPEVASGYFKAMTFKIDRDRYKRLKQLGLDTDKTSQQLLSEAVDLLLKGKAQS